MIRYTYKIVLRPDHVRKDGTRALVLQAFLGGRRTRILLGLFAKPEEFDEVRVQVRIKGEPEKSQKMNAILAKVKSRVEDLFFEAMLHDQPLSLETFEEQFNTRPNLGDFLEWMEQEIVKEAQDKEKATLQSYRTTLQWLRKFRPRIAFTDLNFELVQEWDRWLRKKKLENNTVAKYHRVLRKFVKLARKKKKRMPDAYEDFKFKEILTERTYLTAEEVSDLFDLYQNAPMRPFLRDTLRHFLFQIGTSVRYSDLKRLERSDIVDDMLVFSPQKTKNVGKVVKVPLSNMANLMLAESESKGPKLFNVPVEQIMNRRLKEIRELVGFSKAVTTHVGRHTYGYLFIAAGGTVEVLQKIMGHSDIKTTMIYTHIDTRQIRGGVDRLNLFLRVA